MNNIPLPTSGDDLPERLPREFPGPLPGRLLGIDAGGSATRVVLVADGRVTRRFTAPPMNALLSRDLTDRLAELIGAAGATAAGIGMPGLRSPDEAARLGAELTRRAGCPVQVTGDGETAWLGAFGAAPGTGVTRRCPCGWNLPERRRARWCRLGRAGPWPSRAGTAPGARASAAVIIASAPSVRPGRWWPRGHSWPGAIAQKAGEGAQGACGGRVRVAAARVGRGAAFRPADRMTGSGSDAGHRWRR
jgi:hypothetical protein